MCATQSKHKNAISVCVGSPNWVHWCDVQKQKSHSFLIKSNLASLGKLHFCLEKVVSAMSKTNLTLFCEVEFCTFGCKKLIFLQTQRSATFKNKSHFCLTRFHFALSGENTFLSAEMHQCNVQNSISLFFVMLIFFTFGCKIQFLLLKCFHVTFKKQFCSSPMRSDFALLRAKVAISDSHFVHFKIGTKL